MATADFKSFNYLENGEISFSILDTIKSVKKLDSGSYLVDYIGYPEDRVIININPDKEALDSITFTDKEKLDNLFTAFFDKQIVSKVNSLGFNHKIGILLYGEEGTGKSTIAKNYCKLAVDNNNAIVLYFNCDPKYLKQCWDFVLGVRRIQDNPIIIVFEEIDEAIGNHNEGIFKTILDGNMSIDNCIFFATTNYIEDIPKAIKNRKSRFKYCLDITGVDNKDEIKDIISRMISDICSEDEIQEMSIRLKGETLDTIKQECLDKIMSIKSYEKTKTKIGFTK